MQIRKAMINIGMGKFSEDNKIQDLIKDNV